MPSPAPLPIYWRDVAPGSALHAAYYAAAPHRAVQVTAHTHVDFCELMLVLGGQGEQDGNGIRGPIRGGDLFFLHTRDAHSIQASAGSGLHWINIAFPSEVWRDFRRFADGTDRGEIPPRTSRHLDPIAAARALTLFETLLHEFARQGKASRLLLAGFLAQALPLLLGGEEGGSEESARELLPGNAPAWLQAACSDLLRPDLETGLHDGVPFLRKRAGVSATHLARTMRAVTGKTPTEFINELRLRRAALLLTVTSRSIVEIAADCGFNELGYFYRCFRARYAETPQRYRQRSHSPVAPGVDGGEAGSMG